MLLAIDALMPLSWPDPHNIFGPCECVPYSVVFLRYPPRTSVCTFVFRNSSEVLSESGSKSLTQVLGERTKTMEDVLPLLELWLARAREPINLKVRIEDTLTLAMMS